MFITAKTAFLPKDSTTKTDKHAKDKSELRKKQGNPIF
jgi:hypothetical protein